MPEPIDTNRAALMVAKSKHYQPDPQLDAAAALFFSDRTAWNALPNELKSRCDIHRDFRDAYEAAVQAGLVPNDRGTAA